MGAILHVSRFEAKLKNCKIPSAYVHTNQSVSIDGTGF